MVNPIDRLSRNVDKRVLPLRVMHILVGFSEYLQREATFVTFCLSQFFPVLRALSQVQIFSILYEKRKNLLLRRRSKYRKAIRQQEVTKVVSLDKGSQDTYNNAPPVSCVSILLGLSLHSLQILRFRY